MAKARPKRKPGKTPRFAKSQTELGLYLTPPRDRKIIQKALKLEGNPGRSKDGRYEVEEWQAFLKANFASLSDPTSGPDDKRALEVERLRLQNAKLEFELSVGRRDYSKNSDIETWVGEMIVRTKTVLLKIPGKCAPLVIGRTEVDAERVLRDEIMEALNQLTAHPLQTTAPRKPKKP